MRPTKLSTNLFSELPPNLALYLESNRNTWIESNPSRGRLSFMNRSGVFRDLEALAVERRHQLQVLGRERTRAMFYRIGFEQGRREGARHHKAFEGNARLALQAGHVFNQLQGRYTFECIEFEFDLEKKTLYRESVHKSSVEALIHRVASNEQGVCACWETAGYISGQVSEILGRRVITLETECVCDGDPACRFISKLDAEWGEEADWARDALTVQPIDSEILELKAELRRVQKQLRDAHMGLGDGERKLASEFLIDTLVAESEPMTAVMKKARQIIPSTAPVLLTGESGTGKETLARAIHAAGPRKEGPFVIADCKGVPPEQIEHYLFGGAEGSAEIGENSNAATHRAAGGTLYFDDVTALPSDAQGRLLRHMEQGTSSNGAEDAPAPARIIGGSEIAQTDKAFKEKMRDDLYYALSVAVIELPPLRERGADVLRLAELFLDEFRTRYDRDELRMSTDFKKILTDCAWPGNIRQLRNVMEHAVLMAEHDELDLGDLQEDVLATRWNRQPMELTQEVVEAALRRTKGNRTHAAELLGVGRTTLWRAIKRLNVA